MSEDRVGRSGNANTADRLLVWIASGYTAYMLALSARSHLENPYGYLDAIYGYRLLPGWWNELAAAVLPFSHIAIAIALVAGVRRTQAFGLAAALMAVYFLAQLSVLARGYDIDCGCFDVGESGGSAVGFRTLMVTGCSALAAVVGGAMQSRLNRRVAAPRGGQGASQASSGFLAT